MLNNHDDDDDDDAKKSAMESKQKVATVGLIRTPRPSTRENSSDEYGDGDENQGEITFLNDYITVLKKQQTATKSDPNSYSHFVHHSQRSSIRNQDTSCYQGKLENKTIAIYPDENRFCLVDTRREDQRSSLQANEDFYRDGLRQVLIALIVAKTGSKPKNGKVYFSIHVTPDDTIAGNQSALDILADLCGDYNLTYTPNQTVSNQSSNSHRHNTIFKQQRQQHDKGRRSQVEEEEKVEEEEDDDARPLHSSHIKGGGPAT